MFQKLGCNFLLGTNTLRKQGLVINTAKQLLYADDHCQDAVCLCTEKKMQAATEYSDESKTLSVKFGDEQCARIP